MDSLKYIAVRERGHFMKCTDCGKYFDMRDLQQVFDHFHKSAQITAEYSHSQKVGEPVVYTKDKKRLDLN
jgi:hypothetical protein